MNASVYVSADPTSSRTVAGSAIIGSPGLNDGRVRGRYEGNEYNGPDLQRFVV